LCPLAALPMALGHQLAALDSIVPKRRLLVLGIASDEIGAHATGLGALEERRLDFVARHRRRQSQRGRANIHVVAQGLQDLLQGRLVGRILSLGHEPRQIAGRTVVVLAAHDAHPAVVNARLGIGTGLETTAKTRTTMPAASTTGKSGTFTILKVAALAPTTRMSETCTGFAAGVLDRDRLAGLGGAPQPEKCSSSGVTSSGSRIFSTRGAGKAGSTFGSTLGRGFVAQPPRRSPTHKIRKRDGWVRMA
jgi:hypothetical protein